MPFQLTLNEGLLLLLAFTWHLVPLFTLLSFGLFYVLRRDAALRFYAQMRQLADLRIFAPVMIFWGLFIRIMGLMGSGGVMGMLQMAAVGAMVGTLAMMPLVVFEICRGVWEETKMPGERRVVGWKLARGVARAFAGGLVVDLVVLGVPAVGTGLAVARAAATVVCAFYCWGGVEERDLERQVGV